MEKYERNYKENSTERANQVAQQGMSKDRKPGETMHLQGVCIEESAHFFVFVYKNGE